MTGDRLRALSRGSFDVAPACLGFGCASLGSRIDAASGLRALAQAHERGIVWFDVAPAYGAGEAEDILGRFIKGRRDKLLLTTKVGIAPPARLGAIKLVYAAGRPIIRAASGLRGIFRKMSATRNRHVPLSADLIENSIAASLRRLGTDHVDVYALHDPQPGDVLREDVVRALERVVVRGQARHIAVAGKLDACRAAQQAGAPYSVLQMSVADLEAGGADMAAATQRLVAHSVFGVDGMKHRVESALARHPDLMRPLVAAGYADDAQTAAVALLIDCAFARNPDGVVLASMFDTRHLEANLARASSPPAMQAPDLLRKILERG